MIHQFFSAAAQAKDPYDEIIAYESGICLVNQGAVINEIKEIRKKTWEIFTKALAETLTTRRVEVICKRYGLNLMQFVHSQPPKPLFCRYLQLFSVGSAKIHEEDLVEEGGGLFQKTPEELEILYKRADRLQCLQKVEFSACDSGSIQKLLKFFCMKKLSLDRKRMLCYRELISPLAHRHGYLQRLTMKAIRFQPEEGEILPALDEKSRIDYYKIHRIIAERGLYAVALMPISAFSFLPRLLLFRGTRTQLHQIDCVHSWRNNVQKHIGFLGYTFAKSALDLLMADPLFCPKGKKIVVASYSLGGAHAGYFCLDYWRVISEIVFFNTVSNDPVVAETLAQEINQLAEDQIGPSFFIYRAKGDWAHFSGGKHVGWGISHLNTHVEVQEFTIFEFPTLFDFWFLKMLHTHRFLDHTSNPYEKYVVEIWTKQVLVDKELDNARRAKDVEKMRRSPRVQIVYQFLNALYWLRILAFQFFKGISTSTFKSTKH